MSAGRTASGAFAPGEVVHLQLDGAPIEARAGQTVATVLVERGARAFRLTRKRRRPRGLYCAMGVCFDCLVLVDGIRAPACQTRVASGMTVVTDLTAPLPA